ncbi:hypothetical protein GCM10020000_20070 [Streptomyces olivoverticillatus]
MVLRPLQGRLGGTGVCLGDPPSGGRGETITWVSSSAYACVRRIVIAGVQTSSPPVSRGKPAIAEQSGMPALSGHREPPYGRFIDVQGRMGGAVKDIQPARKGSRGRTSAVRVLVVEDEQLLADAVATGLRREAMAVDVVYDGAAALERIAVNDYDVIVLDRDLPLVHGDDVCRKVVELGVPTRILMLTASGDVSDRVEGLEIGADDYLPKPFAFSELTARVRALGRRTTVALPPVLERAGIKLDPNRREVFRDGREVQLAPKEFAVLEVLMRSEGGRGLGRAAAGEGLGREHRPVHQRRPRHRDDPPPQAGRAEPSSSRCRARDTGSDAHDHHPGAPTAPPKPSWDPRQPVVRPFPWLRPTIRIRLTLLYGGMFLMAGVLLLTIIYLLAADALRQGNVLPFQIVNAQVQVTPGSCEKLGGTTNSGDFMRGLEQCMQHQRAVALESLLRRSLLALLGLAVIAFAFGYAMA